jgi:predicted RNA-binding Zn-ribbon protein involved in translation (DUF1610 family)
MARPNLRKKHVTEDFTEICPQCGEKGLVLMKIFQSAIQVNEQYECIHCGYSFSRLRRA